MKMGAQALVGEYLMDVKPQSNILGIVIHTVDHSNKRMSKHSVGVIELRDVLGTSPFPLIEAPDFRFTDVYSVSSKA